MMLTKLSSLTLVIAVAGLITSVLPCAAQLATPIAIADEIANAQELIGAALYEDAKKTLVAALAVAVEDSQRAEIRFHLGNALFMEGNTGLAVRQWQTLAREYPDSKYSRGLAGVADFLYLEDLTGALLRSEDALFGGYMALSLKMWSPESPDYKMRWDDFKNPHQAMDFYDNVLECFPEPEKQAVALYCQFLLLAGFNADDFGLRNVGKVQAADRSYYEEKAGRRLVSGTVASRSSTPKASDHLSQLYLGQCILVMSRLEEIAAGTWFLVEANYLMGVATSGESFWSGDLKVNPTSEQFFMRVLELTNDNPTSTRRVFASLWLGQYHSD